MMTTVDPFWLHDRIDPEKDNDREEVIKAANAADELTGRRRPIRAINRLDEDDAFDSIRAFQISRNLKVDGVVMPKGPTAQRIAAEQHRRAERKGRAVPAVVGLNAPLWGSVGRGGQNLRGDVKLARSAMMLAGQDFDAPEPGGDENENHAGGAAAADALARFQVQHGLHPDGLMTPFGETHQLLEALLAPRIQALAGSDRMRPKPFEPREPRVVGRTLKVRPTTIRSRFQDEASLPTDAEHRAALDLMAARAGEMDLEMAWQEQLAANPELFALPDDVSEARPVSSIGSEGNAGALFGASGDDVLAGGEGGDDPAAATNDGRQSDPSGVTDESEEMRSALARVAFLGPHLTPMQIEIAAQQVVDTGTMGLSDDRLRALVTRIGEMNPDHANDLRDRIAAGNLDVPGLEGRLTSLTRDRVTAFGNRKRQQRTEATMEVLAEQYVDRSAAEGIEIDREAALQQVRRLMAAVTAEEPIDIELLGDLLWTAVDFVPVAGEFKSAYEAVDLYGQIAEALERDPEADVSELRAEFNLAFLGAVPFLGKGIKLAKLGSKVKGALDLAKSVSNQQRARRKLRKYEKQFEDVLKKRQLTDLIDPKIWENMSPSMRATALSIYVKRKGEAGEIFIQSILDEAGFIRSLKDTNFLRRYQIESLDGPNIVWNLDEVIDEKVTSLFGSIYIARSKGKGTGYEIKLDSGDLTKGQKIAEHARSVLKLELRPEPSVALKISDKQLPLIGRNVRKLRVPMEHVPFNILWNAISEGFGDYNAKKPHNKKIPKYIIENLKFNLKEIYDGYEEDLKISNQSQKANLRRQFTVGGILIASAAAIFVYEEKKKNQKLAGGT